MPHLLALRGIPGAWRMTDYAKAFLAGILLTTLLIFASVLASTGFSGGVEATGEWGVKGRVTYIAGTPFRYAATHHGDRQPTFVQGSRLRLERGGRHTWVKVVDVCEGSACGAIDMNPSNMKRLGISTSQGTGRVSIRCGRRGQLPMRKCLAGEDGHLL